MWSAYWMWGKSSSDGYSFGNVGEDVGESGMDTDTESHSGVIYRRLLTCLDRKDDGNA